MQKIRAKNSTEGDTHCAYNLLMPLIRDACSLTAISVLEFHDYCLLCGCLYYPTLIPLIENRKSSILAFLADFCLKRAQRTARAFCAASPAT